MKILNKFFPYSLKEKMPRDMARYLESIVLRQSEQEVNVGNLLYQQWKWKVREPDSSSIRKLLPLPFQFFCKHSLLIKDTQKLIDMVIWNKICWCQPPCTENTAEKEWGKHSRQAETSKWEKPLRLSTYMALFSFLPFPLTFCFFPSKTVLISSSLFTWF